MTATTVAVLMGVPIDDVTLAEAVERITSLALDQEGVGPHQVATVNVDFLVNAAADERLRALLQTTSLNVPDGMPLVWGSKVAGSPLRERTSGADLLPRLVARSSELGLRVLLFGGAPGVADRAVAELLARVPGADVVALEAPPVGGDGSMVDESVLDEMRASGAQIVCVALGNPKQEWWISRHAAAGGAAVYIGVGGSLDFLAGVTTRAPQWMQRGGIEWLHRAASEPRRLAGRYARDLVQFPPSVFWRWWSGRRRGGATVPRAVVDGANVVIPVGAPLPAAGWELAVENAIVPGGDVTLDLRELGRLDATSLESIVQLRRLTSRRGATLHIEGVEQALAAGGRRLDATSILATHD